MRLTNPPQVEDHKQVLRLPSDEGMPYTTLTKRALKLSFSVHQHQRDKSGLPYVYHPFHLADQMRTEEAACVALLHDAVEDGGITLADLTNLEFPDSVVDAVAALTHDLSVPYMEYVLGLRGNPLAREVMLADLRHNANLSRLDKVRNADRRRRIKYLIAQALLDDSADCYDSTLEPPVWRKRIPLDDNRLHFLSLFYTQDGEVQRCSLDVEAASDEHHVFDACFMGQINEALNPKRSLYEALADAIAGEGVPSVLSTIRSLGVPIKSF